jgi:hypothetical protein
MTSITLNSQNMWQASAPSTGAALPELAVAARRFAAALLSSLRRQSAERTATDDAEALRARAQEFVKTDPGFAADLFAAANRHEGQYGA